LDFTTSHLYNINKAMIEYRAQELLAAEFHQQKHFAATEAS